MKIVRDTLLLLQRHVKKSLQTPIWLLIGLMNPVLYVLLYMPLLRNIGNTQAISTGTIAQLFVPGMLVIMGMGELFAGFGFIPEMREGFITRLLVTPASRLGILMSLILSRMVTLMMQATLLIIISLFLGLRAPVVGVVLALILVAFIGAAMASISYIISLATKREDGLATAVNTFYLPIMLLSGIMLPISLAPEWLKIAAHFNPFYYAVEGARSLFAGRFDDAVVWQGFGIIILLLVIALWRALVALRKMAA